jgi:hypothetical protein
MNNRIYLNGNDFLQYCKNNRTKIKSFRNKTDIIYAINTNNNDNSEYFQFVKKNKVGIDKFHIYNENNKILLIIGCKSTTAILVKTQCNIYLIEQWKPEQ